MTERTREIGLRMAIGARRIDVVEFKSVAIFCGLGVLLSLIAAMSYGPDLAAFF